MNDITCFDIECHVEDHDGTYRIGCSLYTKEDDYFSQYEGKDFTKGINSILDDIFQQMATPKEKKLEDMSLQEQVAYLLDTVNHLKSENNDLVKEISILKEKEKTSQSKVKRGGLSDLDAFLIGIFGEDYYKELTK
jgi:hypothetical protein